MPSQTSLNLVLRGLRMLAILFVPALFPAAASAQLQFSRTSFSFETAWAASPPSQTFEIWSLTTFPLDYTFVPSDSRLRVTPVFGTVSNESDVIRIQIDSASLDPGDYAWKIDVYPDTPAKQAAVASLAVNLRVLGIPPVVVVSPEGALLDETSSATLRVVATGTMPLEFSWEFAPDCISYSPASDDEVLSGTQTAELTIINPAFPNEGCYRCVVSNNGGEDTSEPARVDVEARPFIRTQPAGFTSARPIDTVTLQVVAESDRAIDYQWFFAPLCGEYVALQDNGLIAGSNSATLTITNPTSEDEGCYYCLVSNAVGTATSARAEVEVEHAPIIRRQPVSATALATEPAGFSISATGTDPLEFRWEKRDDSGTFRTYANGGRADGVNGPDLLIVDTRGADSGVYRCVVSNVQGTVPSEEVTLTVSDFPAELRPTVGELRVFAIAGTDAPPMAFDVSNPGGRPLDFTATTPTPWIAGTSVSGPAPRGGTARVLLTFSTASLAMGSYEGSLTLDEVGGVGQSATIPVLLVVVDAFTVTSLLDDGGEGTLRSVLTRANATAGKQTIGFAVAGDIVPLTALPAIADEAGAVIDGGLAVRLRGHRLTGFEDGLLITSPSNIIRNLYITEFPGNGIHLRGQQARSNAITGCRIGLVRSAPAGNRASGILMDEGASENTIGGREFTEQNHISANSFSGITLENALSNRLLGNQIGLSEDGTVALPNGGNGIYILAGASGSLENTLGGDSVFDRNLGGANRYFNTTVFALPGATVTLGATMADGVTGDYQWYRDGTAVGTNSLTFVIESAQPSDTGTYFCTVTNTAGSDNSRPIYLLVASPLRMSIPTLLSRFGSLDRNGDGRLSFEEISAFSGKIFAGKARPLGSTEDFSALDTNGDGFLDVDEVIAGSPFALSEETFTVSPRDVTYPPGDIDDGLAGTQDFVIANLSTSPLDLFSTPALVAEPTEFFYTADSGERLLAPLKERILTVAMDPAGLNNRTAWMNIRTSDFAVPLLPVFLQGFGFQTTPELLGTLSGTDPRSRPLPEVDVNGDEVFDAADVRKNVINGN